MADAIPVNSGSNKVNAKEPEVILAETTGNEEKDAAKRAKLLERAQASVQGDAPVIPDELVNSVGQATSYGKIAKVMEIPYDRFARNGDVVGQGTHLRVDH